MSAPGCKLGAVPLPIAALGSFRLLELFYLQEDYLQRLLATATARHNDSSNLLLIYQFV